MENMNFKLVYKGSIIASSLIPNSFYASAEEASTSACMYGFRNFAPSERPCTEDDTTIASHIAVSINH